MNSPLYHIYRLTRAKYLKLSARLQKNLRSGGFQKKSKYKQNQLISRVEKFRLRVEHLQFQLGIIAAAGAASIALGTMDANAQGLGPFNELPRIENPLREPIQAKRASHHIIDIDGDTDLDLFLGERYGEVKFFQNYRFQLGSTEDKFQEPVINPYNIFTTFSNDATISFADMDNDGDTDAIVSGTGGCYPIAFFRREGASFVFTSVFDGIYNNPFSDIWFSFQYRSNFAFVDIDGDPYLEAFVGNNSTGSLQFIDFNDVTKKWELPAPGSTNLDGVILGSGHLAAAFYDIDGDMELDAFVAEQNGQINMYNNNGDGTFDMATPAAQNPFDGYSFGYKPFPQFINIDGTADLDLTVSSENYGGNGVHYSSVRIFVNDGLNNFTDVSGLQSPFGGVDVKYDATVTMVQIDGDSDLEVFTGGYVGKINFYDYSVGGFQKITGAGNPLNDFDAFIDVFPKVEFADTDNDGDLDAYVGTDNNYGFEYFYNSGSAASPVFVLAADNANSLDFQVNNAIFSFTNKVYPTIGDIDNDGDLDAVVGGIYNAGEYHHFFENLNAPPSPPPTSTPPVFAPSATLSGFSLSGNEVAEFGDLDHDGDLDLYRASSTGNLSTFLNDGASIFSYLAPSNEANHLFEVSSVTGGEGTTVIDIADFDNDGDSDIIVGNSKGQVQIFRNDNQPVTLNLGPGDLNYPENSGPVAGISVTIDDPDIVDNTEIVQVFIKMNNYVPGEDQIVWVDQLNITGTFNPTGDELTLTGSDSFFNYATAVNSITYENLSDDPDVTPRIIDYQAWDSDFTNPGTYSKTINILAVNDPPEPTIGNVTGPIFNEDGPPVAVDGIFFALDKDDVNLTGATLELTTGFVSSQDQLLFTNQLGITGSYNGGTGLLTLSGSSSVANYQTAIRTVTYNNTSDDPDVSVRNVEIILNDGTDPSTPAIQNVIVTAVNDAPSLTATAGDVGYFPTAPPVIIDPGIIVTDPDDINITGAIVQISQNYVPADDVLLFTTQFGITGSFSAGTLTLTGTTTKANYQTALRSIQYQNNNLSTNTAAREISFSVTDDDPLTSPIETRNIQIGDNIPLVTATAAALSYTEDAGPVIVDPGLTVIDDTPNLVGATVTLTGFVSAEDILDFTSSAGITGSYNSGTGILALSGSATPTEYQTVLRSVTYENTSDDPSTASRSFDIVVNDGFSSNTAVSRSINVTAVNDAPALTLNAVSATYTENDPAAILDNTATVIDPDNANLFQILLTINNNYQNGEDVLSAFPFGSVSGSFDAALGVLTISGIGTVSDFETVLRSAGYENTSEDPATLVRDVSILIDDGTDQSAPQTFTVNVTAVNDAPVLAGTGTALDHTGGTSTIDAALSASDVDDTNLSSAEVAITSGFNLGTDILSFTPQGSIAGSYNGATGILSLTGSGTLAEYNSVLQSVTYQNTLGLDVSTRSVQFKVNDGSTDSNIFSRTINVDISDLPPVLALTTSSFNYTENAGAQSIDPGITITDDSPQITGGLVSITTNFSTGVDVLGFTNQFGISGSYDAGTGVLTLSGNATAAQYETALSSLTFENTSEDPGAVTKTVDIQLDDGINTSTSVSLDIQVTPVNDAPALTGSGTDLSYRSLTGSIIIDDQITVSDVDDTNLVGAIISVASNYSSGEDLLEFTDQNGITGNFNTVTGVLSLSGTASKANYETALRTITYQNTAPTPSAPQKTFSFVISDQSISSTVFNRSIDIASNEVIAAAINSQVDLGTSVTIDVISQATFTAGDIITASITTGPTKGTAILNPDGSITYTPNNNNADGDTDQITYELCNEFVSCGSNTITVVINNSPPQISIDATEIQPGGRAVVPIGLGIFDQNGNIDLSSVRIIDGPTSGLPATIDSDLNLIIDYDGSGFTGADHILIEACDFSGACVQFDVVIVVGEVNEVLVYNGVTPNNDGINDVLRILDVEFFPNNEMYVYNRLGKLVYNVTGYDNFDTVFSGLDNNGELLEDGTYYYVIILDSENKQQGFIILQR